MLDVFSLPSVGDNGGDTTDLFLAEALVLVGEAVDDLLEDKVDLGVSSDISRFAAPFPEVLSSLFTLLPPLPTPPITLFPFILIPPCELSKAMLATPSEETSPSSNISLVLTNDDDTPVSTSSDRSLTTTEAGARAAEEGPGDRALRLDSVLLGVGDFPPIGGGDTAEVFL